MTSYPGYQPNNRASRNPEEYSASQQPDDKDRCVCGKSCRRSQGCRKRTSKDRKFSHDEDPLDRGYSGAAVDQESLYHDQSGGNNHYSVDYQQASYEQPSGYHVAAYDQQPVVDRSSTQYGGQADYESQASTDGHQQPLDYESIGDSSYYSSTYYPTPTDQSVFESGPNPPENRCTCGGQCLPGSGCRKDNGRWRIEL